MAVVAAVLPLLFALYAILTTGQALGGRWKFVLVGGNAGLYSLALVGLGVLLARSPARALAGRTLIVCGGWLAALLAAAGWFISGQGILPLVLLNAAAAAALALLAAVAHARSVGRAARRRPDPGGGRAAAGTVGRPQRGRGPGPHDGAGRGGGAARLRGVRAPGPGRGRRWGAWPWRWPCPLAALRAAAAVGDHAACSSWGASLIGLMWALRVIRPRLYHGSVGAAGGRPDRARCWSPPFPPRQPPVAGRRWRWPR